MQRGPRIDNSGRAVGLDGLETRLLNGPGRGQPDRLYAGERANTRLDPFERGEPRGGLGIAILPQRDRRDQHAAGAEAEVGVQQRDDRAQHQARSNEQGE